MWFQPQETLQRVEPGCSGENIRTAGAPRKAEWRLTRAGTEFKTRYLKTRQWTLKSCAFHFMYVSYEKKP